SSPSFFVQAKDGIRDFHVTGVQTCALPICEFLSQFAKPLQFLLYKVHPKRKQILCHISGPRTRNITRRLPSTTDIIQQHLGTFRSEERRVGEELTTGGGRGEVEQEGGRCKQ